jgi:hypothetical protein
MKAVRLLFETPLAGGACRHRCVTPAKRRAKLTLTGPQLRREGPGGEVSRVMTLKRTAAADSPRRVLQAPVEKSYAELRLNDLAATAAERKTGHQLEPQVAVHRR